MFVQRGSTLQAIFVACKLLANNKGVATMAHKIFKINSSFRVRLRTAGIV